MARKKKKSLKKKLIEYGVILVISCSMFFLLMIVATISGFIANHDESGTASSSVMSADQILLLNTASQILEEIGVTDEEQTIQKGGNRYLWEMGDYAGVKTDRNGDGVCDNNDLIKVLYGNGYVNLDKDGNYLSDTKSINEPWNNHFLGYCLLRAGVIYSSYDAAGQTLTNWDESYTTFAWQLNQNGKLHLPNGYLPKAGDVVFWAWEDDIPEELTLGKAVYPEHCGLITNVEIVESIDKTEINAIRITVIEGGVGGSLLDIPIETDESDETEEVKTTKAYNFADSYVGVFTYDLYNSTDNTVYDEIKQYIDEYKDKKLMLLAYGNVINGTTTDSNQKVNLTGTYESLCPDNEKGESST